MAANTGQSSPDDAWLAMLVEEVLEPELPIIDPIIIFGCEMATPT